MFCIQQHVIRSHKMSRMSLGPLHRQRSELIIIILIVMDTFCVTLFFIRNELTSAVDWELKANYLSSYCSMLGAFSRVVSFQATVG